MSFSFRARFDTTELSLPQILERLGILFGELGIRFQKKISRLIPNESGIPTLDISSFEPVKVNGLDEVSRLGEQWWGVALDCLSLPLMEQLGRGAWGEVYFSLFRTSDKRWTLRYSESSTAQEHRLDVEQAAGDLYELQLRLCSMLGFRLSIYDEENDALSPIATLEEIEQKLEQCSRGELGCSILVATEVMTLNRARELTGPQASLVRLSTTGHIVFPLLLLDSDEDEADEDEADEDE